MTPSPQKSWKTWQVLLVLVICSLILLWFKQESILTYITETSHLTVSPSTFKSNSALINAGPTMDHVTQATVDQIKKDTARVLEENETEHKSRHTPLDTKAQLIQQSDKVFFVGDSLMQGVAPHVKKSLTQDLQIGSIDLSKMGTGLLYNQSYDWFSTVSSTLKSDKKIKLMIIFIGTNDTWDIYEKKKHYKFASQEWEQVYRQRVQRILESAKEHRVQVIWLGIPNMKQTKLNTGIQVLNKIYSEEVIKTKGIYLPTRELMGSHDEQYTKFITLINGESISVRTGDGIHFTTKGQQIIADKILHIISGKS